MKLNFVVISDIHLGAMKAPLLYSELEKVFLKEIIKAEKLDAVFIAGDLFDRKLTLNEEHAKYAIKFINNLTALAKKKNFKIRMLRGTRNHDLHQLNNFQYLETKKDIDLRIINTVCEEDMFGDDFKILYLPEEYMEDQDEYYKDTLYNEDKHYDLIVGHGSIEFQSFESLNHLSERKIANAPTFKNQLLMDKANLTVFGHIHNRCNYQEKLYYCGSFSRWIFGEEKPKGFIKFTYDTEEDTFELNYVDNHLAREFKTINIDDIMNDVTKTIDEKIKVLEDIKKDMNTEFVKFKYNVTDNIDDNQIVKNYFAENESITISAKKEKLRQDESERELLKEYGFIFNKEYSLPETISKFLAKKGQKLKPERIEELLNTED